MSTWDPKKIKKVKIEDLGPVFEGHMNCVTKNCGGKIVFFDTDSIKACPKCGKLIKKVPGLLVK